MKTRHINKIKNLNFIKKLICILDRMKKINPTGAFFLLLFFLSINYLIDLNLIWRVSVSLQSFLFYTTSTLAIIGVSYFLNSNKNNSSFIYMKNCFFCYSWRNVRTKDALCCLLATALIMFCLFFISYFTYAEFGHLTGYFLYFYNIAYLYIYCNSYIQSSTTSSKFHVKVNSLFIYAVTVYLANTQIGEPVILNSLIWLFPFYLYVF